MRSALGLARRSLGAVWPNPSVGCILVRDGRVVGRGWTQPGGRPHAESEAIARAGSLARGATAFVTLEPCAHQGETPPCAKALVRAGVARVVVGLGDPDARVNGAGLERLRAAGVKVETGVAEAEAAELNAGYLMRVRAGRPLVTLKAATTLDGRIATGKGESRWVTGEAARAQAHALRASHDAVAVGAATALADDPELTCRLPGLGRRSPVRVVFDGRLRLSLTSRLVETAREVPTWIVALKGAEDDRRRAFRATGVDLVQVEADAEGHPDLAEALAKLGERGLTRLLVEGGGRLAAALLRRRLVDRLVWFHAPRIMGGDGLPAAAGFGVDRLGEAPGFRRLSLLEIGGDLMETYALTT
ncbi:MAG: bifunctional diaminohydroxyphosphoribosylaminopyrimidine deaminase/5-amino-6-(5-phosphoribosylamino)uracil reductase RibD [Alphaproteobacteria bacterium]